MGLPLKIESLTWSFQIDQPESFLQIPSLALDAGKSLALKGASGSGKSSLLFLLAGMEKAQKGSLFWGKTELGSLRESERDAWRRENVGIVFQDFQLIPELSAWQNVVLALSFGRVLRYRKDPRNTENKTSTSPDAKELKKRGFELLFTLGIKNPQQITASLSRGEMQRVALARALLFSPPILLADEPSASLDAENEELVSTLLFDKVRELGASLVVSSHHEKILSKADRVIELKHGKISSDLSTLSGAAS